MTKKIVALALVVVCVLSLVCTASAASVAQIQNGINNCKAAISRCEAEIRAGRNVANNKRLKSAYQSQLSQLYTMLRQAQQAQKPALKKTPTKTTIYHSVK